MLKANFLSLAILCTLITNAQIPSGSIARYALNTNANDITGSGYNGALVAASNTTNRFGAANTAESFTSGVTSGTLPVSLVTAVQNDFTIGFWFKTSMAGATGAQWYNGNSLIDAEVGGVTNDFGIALIDGGKVCFGVGNPDMTIKSVSALYNNNAWHFVTVTRNKAGGAIALYVDGVSVATSTGINTASLTAPVVIGLGRSSAVATGNYTGSLDDIIVYNKVLTALQVASLYTALNATALPVKWLSFTAETKASSILLKWAIEKSASNDYFDVETSADALHFTSAGIIQNDAGTENPAGTQNYSIIIPDITGGSRYFRIKQTDKDGQYAYSKTIHTNTQVVSVPFTLQTNPVAGELLLINHQQNPVQRLQLTDINGKTIRSKNIQSNAPLISWYPGSLAPGYYLLRIFSSSGQQVLPVVKQ